jgi:uncharacterized protein YqgV (UPF0045/DUF77 family)
MKASIDISMYPLDEEFKTPILNYISRLKSYSDILVLGNTMSTQLFGSYDRLMEIMTIENKRAMEDHPAMVIVFKLVNADLRP